LKSKYFILVLLLVFTTALTSCNKQKRIEKNLWKGSGIWKIEYFVETANSNSIAYLDCGIFTFNEDGTGNYFLETNNTTTYKTFSYKLDGNLIILNVGVDEILYNIRWKKDVVEIFGSGKEFKLTKQD